MALWVLPVEPDEGGGVPASSGGKDALDDEDHLLIVRAEFAAPFVHTGQDRVDLALVALAGKQQHPAQIERAETDGPARQATER